MNFITESFKFIMLSFVKILFDRKYPNEILFPKFRWLDSVEKKLWRAPFKYVKYAAISRNVFLVRIKLITNLIVEREIKT